MILSSVRDKDWHCVKCELHVDSFRRPSRRRRRRRRRELYWTKAVGTRAWEMGASKPGV